MTKQWTVATVNYKTSNFMLRQLQSFYTFNDPETFNFVIADNSRDAEEATKLAGIIQPYQDQYNNVKIVPFIPSPTSVSGSAQHGEAMGHLVKEHTETDYIWIGDPDFFVLRKEPLALIQQQLEKPGIVAVGAPYAMKVGVGHGSFPCLIGAAHRTDDLRGVSLMPADSQEDRVRSQILYPPEDGYRYFCFDMGWQVRNKLSQTNNDKNFVAFTQTPVPEMNDVVGQYSFNIDNEATRLYHLNNKVIAFHLSKGSFTGEENADGSDPGLTKTQMWLEAQNACCDILFDIQGSDGQLPPSLQKYNFG